jgi:hypothetical protein
MSEEWLTEMFKVGDWVKHQGFTAFILQCDYVMDEYRIQITKNAQGNINKGWLWVTGDTLTPAEIEQDADFLLGLIDTTLLLNQKEWFLEITQKLPLNS